MLFRFFLKVFRKKRDALGLFHNLHLHSLLPQDVLIPFKIRDVTDPMDSLASTWIVEAIASVKPGE